LRRGWDIFDYLFIELKGALLSLASKKGIVITAAIIVGIVGASLLVWFIPAGGPARIDAPMTDEEVISDIYSRHIDLADKVQSDFDAWQNKTLAQQAILANLDAALADTHQMQRDIQRKPAQEWVQSYDLYKQSLDAFESYLSEMQSTVKSGNSSGPHEELDSLKTKWQDYVDQSVKSMPANKPVT
jgi:hypothetical protein